tara:strand:+ start:1020 stop:1304 length:285 start_codon:yes stop_codon:yes gene_type:complete
MAVGTPLNSETETIEPSTACISFGIVACVPLVWIPVLPLMESLQPKSKMVKTTSGTKFFLVKRWGYILKGYPFPVLATTLARYAMDFFLFSNIT